MPLNRKVAPGDIYVFGCIKRMRCNLLLPMIALSVSPPVCLSRDSTRLHCTKTADQIKMLFGVNTPGGPSNIVWDGGPDPTTERGHVTYFWILGPLASQERRKLESPGHALWAVHSMQPSPNHFGFLLSTAESLPLRQHDQFWRKSHWRQDKMTPWRDLMSTWKLEIAQWIYEGIYSRPDDRATCRQTIHSYYSRVI